MNTITLWYSVDNCGDGSAYPRFFFDEICAEVHQELLDEGWGEPCVGSLRIKSTGDLRFDKTEVLTKQQYIDDLLEQMSESWNAGKHDELRKALKKLGHVFEED